MRGASAIDQRISGTGIKLATYDLLIELHSVLHERLEKRYPSVGVDSSLSAIPCRGRWCRDPIAIYCAMQLSCMMAQMESAMTRAPASEDWMPSGAVYSG